MKDVMSLLPKLITALIINIAIKKPRISKSIASMKEAFIEFNTERLCRRNNNAVKPVIVNKTPGIDRRTMRDDNCKEEVDEECVGEEYDCVYVGDVDGEYVGQIDETCVGEVVIEYVGKVDAKYVGVKETFVREIVDENVAA